MDYLRIIMIRTEDTFKKISENTVNAIKDKFPIKGGGKVLEITGVQLPDANYTTKQEENAKYHDRTMAAPIKVDLQMRDEATGNIIDEQKGFTIAKLPYLTKRGTFIVNGNEYNTFIQNRRRSGIYPIRRQTGEIESEFNIAKGGKGSRLDMTMDPKTGIFQLKVNKAKKNLYEILRSIGFTESQIMREWGKDITIANRDAIKSKKAKDNQVFDTAKRLTGTTFTDIKKAGAAIRERLMEMEMDEDVNKRNVGGAYKNVSNEALMGTSKQMIAINKGTKKPIDRNSIAYKKYHSVEDFLPQRIDLHYRQIQRSLQRKLADEDKIDRVITANHFTKPIKSFFTRTSLSEIGDQYNPLNMLSSSSQITSAGEGGIGNLQTVSNADRALHTSHAGFYDPIHTPESDKIGINLYMALGTHKKGNDLYTAVIDMKTGKNSSMKHTDIHDKVIALPGSSFDRKTKRFTSKTVRAFKDGEIQEVPVGEIDVVIPDTKNLFSWGTSLIPFINNNSGNREFMGAKQMTQALNLVHREVPLVQTGAEGKFTFENAIARGQVGSPDDGVVKSITKDAITIQTQKGVEKIPIYNNLPLNNKHFVNTDKILVKKGQKIKKGQPLYDNNFTKDGTLALGTNLRTAVIPDGGYNFEDGITISESAAKKLTSEHLYNFTHKDMEGMESSPKRFAAWFSNKITKDQIQSLGDDGIIKEGMILKKDDPMILRMRASDKDIDNQSIKQLGRNLAKPWKDASVRWDKNVDGQVVKVVKDRGGKAKIYVKTIEPAKIADKLSGRYGNKGVITRILPDNEMPKQKDGEHMEMLLNPLTVPSRMNPGQLLEMGASKVAHQNGKPYISESFKGEKQNTVQDIKALLKKAGMKSDGTEELYTSDGKKLGNIMAGYHYTLKLSKQAKTGFSARGAGPGMPYDINLTPSSGGPEGGKAIDPLTTYTLLAHGATNNAREIATDKASADPEFWRMVRNGRILPPPKTTFAFDKFTGYLKGAGVNIKRKGNYLQLSPMTDDDIGKLSNGQVTKSQFIQAKDFRELKGGLMDKRIFGGINGDRWGHIDLADKVVNPMFKAGLRSVLGMTNDAIGNLFADEGGDGIAQKLKGINLDELEADTREKLNKTRSPSEESKFNQKLRYINALKLVKMKPERAYLMSKMPVVPPRWRPIIQQEDGTQTVGQVNYLYRDLMMVNEGLDELKKIPYISKDVIGPVRRDLQKAVDAVAGVTTPVGYYHKEREPAGFVQQIKGKRAKEGFFQKKVFRKTQDVAGRAVITPDPKLGTDEVGIPEEMAWKQYDPFLEARLRKLGFSYNQVREMIDARSPYARKVLEKEMDYRPIMLNRSPSLHKFSFMAFKPHIVPGQTLKVPSQVVDGFNADFDGDTMMTHLPVRPEAVEEAKRILMPSQNVFNPRTDKPILAPGKEALLGLYRAVRSESGRKEIKKIIPKKYWGDINQNMDGGDIKDLMTNIAKNNPKDYSEVAQQLKLLGDDVAFFSGATTTLDDLDVDDPVLKKAYAGVYQEYKKHKGDRGKMNEILRDYSKFVENRLKSNHKNNSFVEMSLSKARGSLSQVKQMIGAPVQYTDTDKRGIPIPVLSNFSKGMGVNDFWISLYGARRGMIDRKMETSDPGYVAKQLLISSTRMHTTDDRDPIDNGEEFDVLDDDAMNRYVAKDIKGLVKKGTLLTPELAAGLKQKGVKKINVHTVLSDMTPYGVNAKSYGVFADGKPLEKGDGIGAIAGNAMAEPLQQGIMNSFHTGGIAGDSGISGYEKIKKLLELPKHIAGQATVSDKNGIVESVKKGSAGGHVVTINGVEHFVSPLNKVTIKRGDEVKKGDSISDGFVHPADVMRTKGMDAARRYMVDELAEAYRGSGKAISRRNLEVVVRSITNTATVSDPGDSDYLKGDVAPYDYIRYHNSRPPYEAEVDDDIKGRILKEGFPGIPEGTVINDDVITKLIRAGHKKVTVKNKPITFKPILYGMKQLPEKTGDLLTQMSLGYIKRGLENRVPAMEDIDIHGTNPIPAFVYGAEFGKNKKGKGY